MSSLDKVLRLAVEGGLPEPEDDSAALIRAAAEDLNELALLLAEVGYSGKGDKRRDASDDDESDHDDNEDDTDDDTDNKRPGKKKRGNRKKATSAKTGADMAKCSALLLCAMSSLSRLQGGEVLSLSVEPGEVVAHVRSCDGERVDLSALEDPQAVVLDLAVATAAGAAPKPPAAGGPSWSIRSAAAKVAPKAPTSGAKPAPKAPTSGAKPAPKAPTSGAKPAPSGGAKPAASGAAKKAPAGRYSAVQHKVLTLHQWHQAHLAHLAHLHHMHLEHMERMHRQL